MAVEYVTEGPMLGEVQELAGLPGEYAAPRGMLLLGLVDGATAGCVAVRGWDDSACEMKRLYVRDSFKGQGRGRVLNQSVDVVMTRSVLIYLADKQAGVRELYRVLRPEGRASIFEPINEVSEQVRNQVIASGFYDELQPEWGEIRKYYDAHAKDWWGTLVGWDERELIGWFEAAGFSSVKLSLRARVRRSGEKAEKG